MCPGLPQAFRRCLQHRCRPGVQACVEQAVPGSHQEGEPHRVQAVPGSCQEGEPHRVQAVPGSRQEGDQEGVPHRVFDQTVWEGGQADLYGDEIRGPIAL